MAQMTRLNKVLRELNISIDRAVDFLESKGVEIEKSPNTKISQEVYNTLSDEFQTDASKREKAQEVSEAKLKEKEELREQREREIEEKQKLKAEREAVVKAKAELSGPKQVGKIDLDKKPKTVKEETPKAPEVKETPKVEVPKKEVEKPKEEPKKVEKVEETEKTAKTEKVETTEKVAKVEKVEKTEKVEKPKAKEAPKKEEAPAKPTAPIEETLKTQYKKLSGPNITGKKIDLSQFNKPKKKKEVKPAGSGDANKRKRRRISKGGNDTAGKPNFDNRRGGKGRGGNAARPKVVKEEPTEEDVKKQIRETLEKLQGKSNKGKGAKYRRDKRDQHREQTEIDQEIAAAESKTIKVTEFVTVSEIATMMEVGVTQVISACMSLGMMVTMNQRLDAETLTIVAEEFGYDVEFITAGIEESIEEVEDKPEDLKPRAPIVTVMGHVDHGKTSLLDYIREENVIAGESGGITQHIGAYGVELADGQKIAFLDTPGHEAFTAMRARGAQVTDIAIIVVAADDAIMPQTKEAISHAQAAGVPIVFAINKIDKPDANPEKVKEQLAQMNLLVEDWGGKIQSHDISAKVGTGVKELLEKVLLEAELLELKANPNKAASGTVVEAYLDKGRGYVSTILVQAGTLKVGDYVLAGKNSGKVKAMQDERGHDVAVAGPATPVSILGLDGAPQAGDKFNVFEDEREAKQIATKRTQLQREQSVRTQRHITLDEIGRRIALGDFQELNIILKGDVDGSVEALTDSFQKLSTEEIQVNIIHKGVGAITESDVLLATASDAIIVGFNVRPVGNARMIADKEEIDIRTYSIIYAAINDLKDAMEGMLSPEVKEEVTGTAEIREIFKVSKVGNIAGCMVMNGKIFRNSGIRIIRDGVVVHTGTLEALKRFKDDVREVAKGYDCGMQIKGYNDIAIGDVIEAFQEVEVKKKLK
ncbi:translation initiation factor IF-2 [uncultured Winogradskyella sp.]|uniref:translation initiation factor IF-2 n=1 Tax=uncultured Winogradskyella sp. TaxID=395353 RepID=UPI00262D3871|nr:translation initiation factor IF-2 [uncultured Winogradskyella sp.]|tara:strand:- start:7161 stop:9956 length:2796 start_codon:yes stop_codon:yes gene_type:complete